MAIWNPWHDCMKISSGCNHCYVYEKDAEFGKDASKVRKTSKFDLPIQRNRKKEYKLMPEAEPVYTCMTSDINEPMLEQINIEKYLASGSIEQVICGDESGENARV